MLSHIDKVTYWKNYFLESYGTDFNYMTYQVRFDNLYRGRSFENGSLKKVQKTIKKTINMWCPPKCKCSKQRCNLKGDPLLYVSSHISSIPLELNCRRDNLLVIISYRQSDYLSPLAIIGWEELMKIPDGISELIKNHFKNKSKKVIEIDKKISKIFITHRRDPERFDIYNISIGLTNLFLKKAIGIIYPSVATNHKSFNIVLRPHLVKSILCPVDITIYKVMDLLTTESVGLQRLSIGEILTNGKIRWKEDNEQTIFKYEK